MGRIGGMEILLILLIALLIFGPSKLADMGKGLGEGLKNFKKGISHDGADDESTSTVAKPVVPDPPKALVAGTPGPESPAKVNEPAAAPPVKPGES